MTMTMTRIYMDGDSSISVRVFAVTCAAYSSTDTQTPLGTLVTKIWVFQNTLLDQKYETSRKHSIRCQITRIVHATRP